MGEFGARLRRVRQGAGLNGKQLAAALSWPHSKVSKVELGRQRPTADEVAAWVAATGASEQLDDLLLDLRSSGSSRRPGGGNSAGGTLLVSELLPGWRRQPRSSGHSSLPSFPGCSKQPTMPASSWPNTPTYTRSTA